MKCYIFLWLVILSINISSFKAESLKAEGLSDSKLAHEHEFKYQVSLHMNSHLRCGGAILAEYFISTGASCFFNITTGKVINGNFTVIASTIDIYDLPEAMIIDQIIMVYVPKEFQPINKSERQTHYLQDDIAVAMVRKGFSLARRPYLTSLNIASLISYENKIMIITGHGFHRVLVLSNTSIQRLKYFRYSKGRLRFSNVSIESSETCLSHYADFNPDKQICGKLEQRRENLLNDLCAGDNGSPLVFEKNVLSGIAGYINEKCRGDLRPAVFTKVEYYSQFIDDAMNHRKLDKMRTAGWKKSRFSLSYQFVEY